jgi:hypothetical protein
MPNTVALARWRALIHEFTSSNETVAAFCERRGLARPTFYQWRRRLDATARPPAPVASAPRAAPFLPVRVASVPAAPPGGVEVVLRGGRRLRLERGFDPAVLAAALAALEGAAC